jgi:hypothetical protein
VKLQAEWSEFLGLLRRHGVRNLIVGGMAVLAHGRERYTKDLDLFVEPSERNAERLGRALADFGFTKSAREWRRLAQHYQILTLGREPNRIDILTSIAAISFPAAWKHRRRVRSPIGAITIIGLADLRMNKLASGRPIDLVDLALLDELELDTRAGRRTPGKRPRRAAKPSRRRR